MITFFRLVAHTLHVNVAGETSVMSRHNLSRTPLRRVLCVVAATFLSITAIAPASAQEPVRESGAETTYRFSIPAGPLGDTLVGIAELTGHAISVDPELVRGREAAAVSGDMTPVEAVTRALDGSGLRLSQTSNGTMTVRRIDQGVGAATFMGDDPIPHFDSVVVYGAKNAATLGDVTASVGIVSAEDIENHQLQTFREAFRTIGNVMDADWPDAGFVIRGVNSEGLTPGGAPLASLYIDGVQQTVNGARRGARGLWDIEQVEVYRGPQSTLSGRAALAGAIYIKTEDPGYEWEKRAQVTAGSMETRGGAFTLGGPLVDDQVAFRLSAEYQRSENDINYPTYEDFARFDEFIEDEYYQIRGKLLFEPESSPETRALLTYSYSHDSPYSDDIAGPVLGFSYDERRGDFNVPVFAESRSTDNQNLALEIGHEVNPSLLFTSLTAYSSSDMERPSVNEGTAGETNIVRGSQEQSILTQEFRLNYTAESWDGVLGVYLADEESDTGFDRPDFFGFAVDVSRGTSDATNVAVFGEIAYGFRPSWKLIAGGRADYTDQEGSNFFSRNGTATVDESFSSDESVFLPKLGLVKEIDANQSVGFTVQQGFRTGGAGVQTSSGESFTFDPEFAWNYEVSYKGSLLDDRLGLNVNVFYMDWRDQQVEVLEDPLDFTSAVITNAASSSSKGFEVETTYEVSRELTTFASIGRVDTHFDDFVDQNLGDLSGFPFPEAPKWNVAVGGFYQTSQGYFVGADAKYLSRYLARFGSDPQEYLDGYTVVNAQAGYRAEHWKVTLFAENLFDKEYFVYNDRDTTGDIAATLGPRQVIGISLGAEF